MKIFEKTLNHWKHLADNKLITRVPYHLDLELTNQCNLTCDHCPYHGKDAVFRQEPCDMEFEMYEKIILECAEKGTASVKLSFSGEPFLYNKFFKAVKFAKENGLETSVNTNGLAPNGKALSVELCKELMDCGLDVLIITDYGIEDQYKGICILQVQKQVLRKDKPYVMMKSNSLRYKGIVDEIVPLSYDEYTNLTEDRVPREFTCGFPWQRLLITASGDILMCSCGMGLYDLDNSIIGNVRYMKIEDAWNSVKMNFLRTAHEHGDSHLLRMCRFCPIRGRNVEK